MIRRPQRSTLFPSTTLFQSESEIRSADLYRPPDASGKADKRGSEEHTSELQSLRHLVCRLLLEKKKLLLDGIALGDAVALVAATSGPDATPFRGRVVASAPRVAHPVACLAKLLFFLMVRGPPEISPFPLPAAFPF